MMLRIIKEAYGIGSYMSTSRFGWRIDWDRVRRTYQRFEATRKLLNQSQKQHIQWLKKTSAFKNE